MRRFFGGGGTIAAFQYLKGCHWEQAFVLFSVIVQPLAAYNLQPRKNFLIVRTIDQWNRLPQEVVSVPSQEVLQERLDLHLSTIV